MRGPSSLAIHQSPHKIVSESHDTHLRSAPLLHARRLLAPLLLSVAACRHQAPPRDPIVVAFSEICENQNTITAAAYSYAMALWVQSEIKSVAPSGTYQIIETDKGKGWVVKICIGDDREFQQTLQVIMEIQEGIRKMPPSIKV